jgi:hypothetical protein
MHAREAQTRRSMQAQAARTHGKKINGAIHFGAVRIGFPDMVPGWACPMDACRVTFPDTFLVCYVLYTGPSNFD